MGLKILHTADWHLDSPLASVPEKQREQLRANLRRIPAMVADLCIQEECDLVLIAGDVFDGTPSAQTVASVQRALERCRVPVLIAPGNHDFVRSDSPWMAESWPENVHVFTGGLSAVDLPALSCRIYGAGYRSMDCPALLDGFQAEGDAAYCLAVLHGDPMQVNSPCCPVTAAQVRESGLDYLALGHLHRTGSFRAGSTLCAWPGCPVGRGWDETGEKGVLITTLDDRAETKLIPLGLPEFRDLTLNVMHDAVEALETALPPVESQDFYRVTLTGTGSVDANAMQQKFSHLAYLELRDELQPETDPWEHIDEDSLRGVYFRMLREQLEAADEEQAATIRMAAEISAQLLEGREVALP